MNLVIGEWVQHLWGQLIGKSAQFFSLSLPSFCVNDESKPHIEIETGAKAKVMTQVKFWECNASDAFASGKWNRLKMDYRRDCVNNIVAIV